jgi:hypothetical protein
MKRPIWCLHLRLIVLFATLFIFHADSQGQPVTVTGTVTDSLGTPIENVSVKIKGSGRGTVTDARGAFTLPAATANATLVFSSVGYGVQEKVVGNGPLTVVLMAGNETLTDVVILGYTQQSQTKTTAAISKLNIAELQNRPSPNPVQAMQGKIAGVSVPGQFRSAGCRRHQYYYPRRHKTQRVWKRRW